jgi:hypothetical protein
MIVNDIRADDKRIQHLRALNSPVCCAVPARLSTGGIWANGFSAGGAASCGEIAEKTAASLKIRQYNCFKPDHCIRRF